MSATARGPVGWGRARTGAAVLGIALLACLPVAGGGALAAATAEDLLAPGVAADGTVEGLRTFEGLTNFHVDPGVDYDPWPPVGGDHLYVWQDCGFYDTPVVPEAGVHSLEHGAVWVTYDPGLPGPQVERLRALAEENAYLLVSPAADLPAPVVASAWGVQVRLRSADDVRLPAFLATYQQGPQTPELGAPCSGGLAEPAELDPQV